MPTAARWPRLSSRKPGRTTRKTPAKPASTAAQRQAATLSFRMIVDSSVTRSGDKKISA
jgi:hypothetical protein